ncbi:MAG: hypothetical protein II814_00830, partial [Treponema sp.]|nr:hypothetical protein [Treponema sp.]
PGEDDFSRRLSEFVARVKENEKFRKEFSDMNLHDFDIMTEAKEEGLVEGRAEGARQKSVENARNALAMNLSAEQAAQITGLPLEQVLELQKELTPTH